MPPIFTRKTARKLVLGRETVRTLTGPRSLLADATVDGRATSCGDACSCACDTQLQTF
jgi:hypothetical protein